MNHTGRPTKAQDYSIHDLRRARLSIFLVFMASALFLAAIPIRELLRSPGIHSALVARGIDPNTEHWFELSQLPGIGESLARRIIEYRVRRESDPTTSNPIFHSAADLDPVSGMGGKTIRRLQPFLRLTHAEK
jgi:hypothetical protein